MRKNFLYYFLVLCFILMSAFSFVPISHKPLEINRFIPEAVCELPPVATLTLTASDIVDKKGATVCVKVGARSFDQILSMQFSMNWDDSVLKFKELRNFDLRGLNRNNFGEHLVTQGQLTFSWYDPNLVGVSKQDNARLYEVCFEIIGNPGSKTTFGFSGQPTLVEIANATGLFLDLRTEGGSIEVK